MKAMAEKRNLILDPTSGKETQAISDAIVSTPKNIIDLAATAFK
jgi:hypothetical protein